MSKKLSPKQLEIVRILHQQEDNKASVDLIFSQVSWAHYYYKKTHLGLILKSMVANKSIHRLARGVYGLGASSSNVASSDGFDLFNQKDTTHE